MSQYFVSSLWENFYPDEYGEINVIDVDISNTIDVKEYGDVLSDPSIDDLLSAGLSLWPRGAAWGSPDGEAVRPDSLIAKLTAALLSPFADLYARAWQVIKESRYLSIVESLDDWERDYGLPDPCGVAPLTDEGRILQLGEYVRGIDNITPADIIRLANRLGYVIAIFEPSGMCCGDPLDEAHVLGVADYEQQWVVMVKDAPVTHFETGIGETGVTLLTDFEFSDLMCAIERIRPAWSKLVFNFGPHEIYAVLATDEGANLIDDAAREIRVRIVNARYVS